MLRARRMLAAWGLVLASCSTSTTSPTPPTASNGSGSNGAAVTGNGAGSAGSGAPNTAQDGSMTLKEHDYERGPSIYPADKLQEWLEKQRTDIGEVVLRLPVLCTLKPNRMYLKSATVGDQAGALAIKVNDTSLGVPISAKMQQLCEGKDSCMLWLRGVWRGGDDKEFQVSRVDGVVEDADRPQATFAEVAKK